LKRRRHLVLAAAFLSLGPWFPPHPALAGDQPQLEIEHAMFEFGSVVSGQTVSHAFMVRNRGETPLTLEDVSAPCACFHASFDRSVAAGQAGRIEVSIDTSELLGPVFLTARVRSSDPARPVSRVVVKGVVNGPIALLPRDHVDLTTVQGDDMEQIVTLEVNRKRPLEVLRVESSSKTFAPRWETLTPGRRYRIVVKANGSEPVGLHRGTLRIHTDDPDQAIIPLECSLLVVSSVVAEPETLFLPTVGQAEARKGLKKESWKVVVRNMRGRSFAIVALTSDLPFVRVWNRIRPDGKSYDVFVELQPNEVLLPGRTVGSLHVRTDLPDAQDVKVPVWVEVR